MFARPLFDVRCGGAAYLCLFLGAMCCSCVYCQARRLSLRCYGPVVILSPVFIWHLWMDIVLMRLCVLAASSSAVSVSCLHWNPRSNAACYQQRECS